MSNPYRLAPRGMFLTVHSLAGEVLAQSTDQPWLALVIGFLSHFPFDMIPHGDEHIGEGIAGGNTRKLVVIAGIDLVIMVTVQTILFASGILPLTLVTVLAGIGAMLPDALQLPALVLRNPPRIFVLYRQGHDFFHYLLDKRIGTRWGMTLQTATLVVLIMMLR